MKNSLKINNMGESLVYYASLVKFVINVIHLEKMLSVLQLGLCYVSLILTLDILCYLNFKLPHCTLLFITKECDLYIHDEAFILRRSNNSEYVHFIDTLLNIFL